MHFDGPAQAFSQFGADFQRTLGKHYAEFLSADPGRQIGSARAFLEDDSQLFEDFIAGIMPVVIIDLLEVVDIDNQEAKHLLVELFEEFGQISPIGQPGQWIVASLGFGLLQLIRQTGELLDMLLHGFSQVGAGTGQFVACF